MAKVSKRKAEAPRKRDGVSAESYGKHNKKEDFQPVVVPKDPKQRTRILQRIGQNVFLKGLSQESKELIVDAMREVKLRRGETVIRQGEKGDEFFVVAEGEVDCMRVFQRGEEARFLKTYGPGEGFGELALLYNAPRAASLVSAQDSVLFALDRQTFNHVVRDSTVKLRQRYEELIDQVELLGSLDKFER